MEGEFGTPRKLRPAYPIICFYKVGFKIRKGELPSELFLLMDRETISGSNAIEINGRVVEASLWKPVRVNDFNNQAADIRSLVREGENEIRIRVCIRKDEDGLRDPFYLWGSLALVLRMAVMCLPPSLSRYARMLLGSRASHITAEPWNLKQRLNLIAARPVFLPLTGRIPAMRT